MGKKFVFGSAIELIYLDYFPNDFFPPNDFYRGWMPETQSILLSRWLVPPTQALIDASRVLITRKVEWEAVYWAQVTPMWNITVSTFTLNILLKISPTLIWA